jgi:hypothetical protein
MATLLRLAAITAAGFVALSFIVFAVDQSKEGSAQQVEALDGGKQQVASGAAIDVPAPDAKVERVREARHTGIRELIDDGNDVLVAPFTGIVESSNLWVERMVPSALALLLFGLGGMMLANCLPKPRRRHTDWRQATS